MKEDDRLERIVDSPEGGKEPSMERARARWSALSARLFDRNSGGVSPEFTAKVMLRVLAARESAPAGGVLGRWAFPALGFAASATAVFLVVTLSTARPAVDLSTTAMLDSRDKAVEAEPAEAVEPVEWAFNEEAVQPEDLMYSMVEVSYEE